MRKIDEQDVRDAELVIEVTRMSEADNILEIEGIDPTTGKSFKTNFMDIKTGRDTLDEAIRRSDE